MKNFRVLKNLGSRIFDVRPYLEEDRTGYLVIYDEGDQCLSDPSKRYMSKVRYQCNPEGNTSLNDFPKMIEVEDYAGSGQCSFDFIWSS